MGNQVHWPATSLIQGWLRLIWYVWAAFLGAFNIQETQTRQPDQKCIHPIRKPAKTKQSFRNSELQAWWALFGAFKSQATQARQPDQKYNHSIRKYVNTNQFLGHSALQALRTLFGPSNLRNHGQENQHKHSLNRSGKLQTKFNMALSIHLRKISNLVRDLDINSLVSKKQEITGLVFKQKHIQFGYGFETSILQAWKLLVQTW